MCKTEISSISINMDGTVVITIEGAFPAPSECDDPLVELFRPIRVKYSKDVMYSILANHQAECTVCTLLPSNNDGHTLEEFKKMAITALKGDTDNAGILSEYRDILEKYFQDPKGLNLYLEKINQIPKLSGAAKTILCNGINNDIKEFVTKNGFIMPSLKQSKKK